MACGRRDSSSVVTEIGYFWAVYNAIRLSVACSRFERMNEATDMVIRVPAEVLASRPFGVEVAGRVADLVEALHRAAGEPPAQRDTDPEVATEADLVDEIGCWERAKARSEARQVKAMAALAASPMFAGCAEHGSDDPTHGARGAASIVSAELRISPGHARTRVELACELVEDLPAVVEALAAGRIDAYKARVLAEETRPLAEHRQLRRRVVDRALAKADKQTATQLRAAARKLVLAADPAGAKDRHQRARKQRAVYPAVPGTRRHGLAAAAATGRGRTRVVDRRRRRRPAGQDRQPRRPAHPGPGPRRRRGRPGLVRAVRRAPGLL